MKQTVLFSSILFTLLLSCSKSKQSNSPSGTDIAVIIDFTDSFATKPDANYLLHLFDFDNNKDQSADITITALTDRMMNPTIHYNIPTTDDGEKYNHYYDRKYRSKAIQSFYEDVRVGLAYFQSHYKPDTPLQHSECFCTISTAIRELKNKPEKRKILIVYSDLLDNTSFDAYSTDGRKMMQNNPEEVASILMKRCRLPWDLRGIEVHIIYQPLTREQDARFMDMAAIYSLSLQRQGATVYFQTNNDNSYNH